jgi:hypothetical protein
VFAALVGTAAFAAVAACSSSDSSNQATTTTTAPNRSFQVATPDGQVSLSLDGQLPPNWPTSFPLPPGAQPAGSGSLGGASKTGLIAIYSSPQSPQDVFTFYTTQSSLTVESQSSIGAGDAYVGTIQLGGSPSGRVTTLPKGGQTLIVITLGAGGPGTTGTTLSSRSTGTTG